LTQEAERFGTPTSLPRTWRVATETPTARVVTATPAAENSATATAYSLEATAIAITTGERNFIVVTSTPTPSDTPTVFVVTPTPQPADIYAAATNSVRLTQEATRIGTATPLPDNWRVDSPTRTPRVATPTPTALNGATATVHAIRETAIAITTVETNFVVATSTSTRTPTLTPIPSPTEYIITPTPLPVDVLEAATRKAEEETQLQRGETSTPLPPNAVVATVTRTPRVVTNTPTPLNEATATANVIFETAIAYTTGTARNFVTATPTPTNTPREQDGDNSGDNESEGEESGAQAANRSSSPPSTPTPTPAPTPVSTPTPLSMPVPESAEAIRFEDGATSATIYGYVEADEPVSYILEARAGQPMRVVLLNQSNYAARLLIQMEDGGMLGATREAVPWGIELPRTGEYYLTIFANESHDYSLWVEILP
jgi:hypothetical protein